MSTTNRNSGDHDEPRVEDVQAQASHFSRKLGQSAERVWLAGLGALGRAQSEGNRLFESLVKEGANYQSDGKRQAEAIRDQVEVRFDQTREKAKENWHKLGRAFDERVKSVLHTLQVPDRDEVEALRAELEALKSQLHETQVRARRTSHGKRPQSPQSNPTPDSVPPEDSE